MTKQSRSVRQVSLRGGRAGAAVAIPERPLPFALSRSDSEVEGPLSVKHRTDPVPGALFRRRDSFINRHREEPR